MTTKTCKGCGETKDVTEFYSNGFTPAGTQKRKAYCGPCWMLRTRSSKETKLTEVLLELNMKLECELCGYNKNWAALNFHHVEEGEKDFGISEVSGTTSKEKLKTEIEKCVLLCANCHMEVHYPHLEIVVDDNQKADKTRV